jgi:hypothetical protein
MTTRPLLGRIMGDRASIAATPLIARLRRVRQWIETRWPGLGWVLLVWGLSRLAFYLAVLLAGGLVPPNLAEPARVDVRGHWLLALHWRWDAIYYYSIATGGYAWDSLAVFFPLLPLLIRATAIVLGGFQVPQPLPIGIADRAPLIAGVLVAHAAALLAFWFLFQLAREETADPGLARRVVLYTAIFPLAYHYAMPFTEGLFLATTAGTMLAARRGHWIRAGLWCAAATATRAIGILVVPALVLEVLLARQHGMLPRHDWPRALLSLLLTPLGLGLFMLHLWQDLGDPLAFSHQEVVVWGHQLLLPTSTLARGITYALHPQLSPTAHVWMVGVVHLVIVLIFLAVLVGSLRWWRPSYSVYGVLLVATILATSVGGAWAMHSLGRYVMIFFPVYFTLARWGRHPAVDRAILVLWLPLFGLFAALAVRWYGI